MDGLRKCICATTRQMIRHVAKATTSEVELVVSFSVSYRKSEWMVSAFAASMPRIEWAAIGIRFPRLTWNQISRTELMMERNQGESKPGEIRDQ